MADMLARRMVDNQIRMRNDDLKRDADRLANTVKQYAEDLGTGRQERSSLPAWTACATSVGSCPTLWAPKTERELTA
jgi:hypothetical protein